MERVVFFILMMLFAATQASAESARAVVRSTGADAKEMGQVRLVDSPEGLKVTAQLSGLTPGKHAFHIHDFGDCSDSGKAAGGHYNPAGAPHGFTPKDGAHHAHAGDMGNLEAGEQGETKLEVTLPGVSLAGALPVAGRSVIVHEKEDDFSQPTGNAGGRAACGEILIVSP